MASTAHISYPSTEEDEDLLEVDEVVSEDVDGIEDEPEREPFEGEESCDAHDAPVGRDYSVSPEDFCAEPYRQDGSRYDRQELGRRGEEAAVRYLEARGYEILKRNWFCKFGEADIIARDEDGTLCFIEVKTRQSIEAGLPEESITKEKQSRYERIALCYMMVEDDWDDNDPVRFDAIGICVTKPHRALLRHHRGCFNAGI